MQWTLELSDRVWREFALRLDTPSAQVCESSKVLRHAVCGRGGQGADNVFSGNQAALPPVRRKKYINLSLECPSA